eukprot:1379187-Pyramimonas_sp.AAC.1
MPDDGARARLPGWAPLEQEWRSLGSAGMAGGNERSARCASLVTPKTSHFETVDRAGDGAPWRRSPPQATSKHHRAF